jgi:hypothetical protein
MTGRNKGPVPTVPKEIVVIDSGESLMATVRVVCPECKVPLKLLSDVTSGRKIRCPRCQASFPLELKDTGPTSRPFRDSETSQKSAGGRARNRPSRPRSKSEKKAKPSIVLWAGLAIGAVLLILGVTLFFVWQGKEEGKATEGRPLVKDGRPGNVEPHLPPPDEGFDKLPVWAPGPALLQELGPYVPFREHRMRLPKGYKVLNVQEQGELLWYSIQGPQTSEKYSASLDACASPKDVFPSKAFQAGCSSSP